MNKRILIQQRSLACLSKSVAHILQRELYTIGNTGLLRQEAEMTLLQPQFWGCGPYQKQKAYQNKPFCGPHHNKKRGSYRKRPYRGAIPLKAVTNHFPQVGRNQTQEASGVVFDPTQGDEGVETPPPNDSLQASLSPPVGGCLHSFRIDWLTNKCSNNVFNIITNGYVLPFLSNQI